MKTLSQFFDKIYLINLDSRPDRLQSATALLHSIGVTDFLRIAGKFDNYDESLVLGMSKQSVKNAHLECLLDALENGYDNILIFEDDIVLNQHDSSIESNLSMHIDNCIEWLENNEYDLFYFDNIKGISRNQEKTPIAIHRFEFANQIQKIYGKAYAHSYAVSKRFVGSLIAKQRELINSGNDGVLGNIIAEKYIYSPGIFDQRLNDISNNTSIPNIENLIPSNQ